LIALLSGCGDSESATPGSSGRGGSPGSGQSGKGGSGPGAGAGSAGKSSGEGGDAGDSEAGAGTTAGDDSGGVGGEGGEASPDAAEAFRWEVNVASSPSACHEPGAAFEPTVSVYDRDGAPISNPSYEVTSDIDGAIEDTGAGSFVVQGEGVHQITVTFTGDAESGASLEPVTFAWISDGSGPEIAVSQPARGAMLVGAGDTEVVSQVTDAVSAIDSITLNGEELLAMPTGSHSIDTIVPATWGLNVLELVATDACGHTTRDVQSYLRSESYRGNATSPAAEARLTDGPLLMTFTQEAMADPTSGGRTDRDDVATLLQAFLQANLYRMIGPAIEGVGVSSIPSCGGLGYDVVALAMDANDVIGLEVSDLRLQSYGLSQNTTIERVSVPLDVEAILGTPVVCTQVSAVAYPVFSAAVSVAAQVGLTQRSDGTIDATNRSVVVTLSDPEISETSVALVDSVLEAVGLDIVADIEEEIETTLETVLPALVETFLNELTSFEAPPAGLPSGLLFTTGGEALAPSATALTQTFHAQTFPTSVETQHPALGSIVRALSAPIPSSHPGPLIFAADDNLINQGLWALWYGGGLEVPDLIGYPGASLRVSGLLPPVVMPADDAGEIRLGLGDLDLTLDLELAEGTLPSIAGPVSVEAYVSYFVEGAVAYDGLRQQLTLTEPTATTYLQVRSIGDRTSDITDAAAREEVETYASDLIERALLVLARGSLGAVFVPPPAIAFSEPIFGGTLESLVVYTDRATRAADHVVFDARFTAELNVPTLDTTCLTTNRAWSSDDLAAAGISEKLSGSLAYAQGMDFLAAQNACPPGRRADDEMPTAFSTSAARYSSLRDDCDRGTTFLGSCIEKHEFPIQYGWYCGALRPIDDQEPGDDDSVDQDGMYSRFLDPVDYCCCLHDVNLFDQAQGSASPENACGMAMCLRQAVGFPSESALIQVMPEVMRARQNMYDMATILCEAGSRTTIAPLPALEVASSLAECRADTLTQ
jgi:hypothetical protein